MPIADFALQMAEVYKQSVWFFDPRGIDNELVDLKRTFAELQEFLSHRCPAIFFINPQDRRHIISRFSVQEFIGSPSS
jgi:hypothetical protein